MTHRSYCNFILQNSVVKAEPDDITDEDQIPLSRLKSERNGANTYPTPVTTSHSWTERKPAFAVSQAIDSTGGLGSRAWDSNPISAFLTAASIASSGAGGSGLRVSAATTTTNSASTVTSTTVTSTVSSKPLLIYKPQVSHPSGPVPAHRMLKAHRPLNILGPCHPHLLTAAQRSPYTTRTSTVYPDPMLIAGSKGGCLISELKRSIPGEALDLSAKKQKMIPAAHSSVRSSGYPGAADCGAIDLSIDYDKPLSLVKVKCETSVATTTWDSHPWKPQDEPINFSRLHKSVDPRHVVCKPPPLVRNNFTNPNMIAPHKPELLPSTIPTSTVSTPQYPASVRQPSSYMAPAVPTVAPPSYTNSSLMHSDRGRISQSTSRDSPLPRLQIDLTREGSSSASSTRYHSPNNVRHRPLAPSATKLGPTLSSPRPTTAIQPASRHTEPPPRYDDYHRRIEPAHNYHRHKESSLPTRYAPKSAADSAHTSDGKLKTQSAMSRHSTMLSPRHRSIRPTETVPSPAYSSPAYPSPAYPSPTYPSSAIGQLQAPQQRIGSAPANHMPISLQRSNNNISSAHSPASQQGQGDMTRSLKQVPPLSTHVKAHTDPMRSPQSANAAFSPRRIETSPAHKSSNVSIAHKPNHMLLSAGGMTSPRSSADVMSLSRSSGVESAFRQPAEVTNQRPVVTANEHKLSSLSPNRPPTSASYTAANSHVYQV